MLDERTLRRDDFMHGFSIRLADRQNWSLPTPESLMQQGLTDPREQAQYQSLTRSILEAGSRVELLRAEMALTIFLLSSNYELSPSECFAVLCFPPGDEMLSEVQTQLHALSMEHVRARRNYQDARPVVQVARTQRSSFLRRVRASLSA